MAPEGLRIWIIRPVASGISGAELRFNGVADSFHIGAALHLLRGV